MGVPYEKKQRFIVYNKLHFYGCEIHVQGFRFMYALYIVR